ncbi:MAG: glycosyltransferase [Lachnospiraceae bacterium]|uniref:glycosyltransferase n=1 Tax=Roseburia hominis TaxID=301301 RepID=UPI001F188CF1|nr:glycosyltransferase family 1 protein [Roseburia hominis]MCI5713742.1 glycosyltransferase [Lachnospiraceae bacterium]MDD6169727.1 glycosyltransferase [Lachnospiraceae bacterium]
MKKPVLFFSSREICYYSSQFFAAQLAESFEKCGYPVEVCVLDLKKDIEKQLAPYEGKSYEAIVDFNSLLPHFLLEDDSAYVDHLDGPFFNYLVDHPMYHHPGLIPKLKNYHVLCVDEKHVAYVQHYYEHIKSVSMLPLAANEALLPIENEKKKEAILFPGTYRNKEEIYKQICELPKEREQDTKKMIELLQANEEMSQEEALRLILQERGEELTDAQFAVRMNEMYHADLYLRNYYREEAVRALIAHRIPVTVMGGDWDQFAQDENKYFKRISPVDFSVSFQKIAEYQVLLNVSPLFRAGVHDRVFAAMANRTACITEQNRYMKKHFKEKENVMLFSVKDKTELSNLAEELLINKTKQRQIAENAYEEFKAKHSWDKRTQQFLEIIKRSRQ